MEEAERAKEGLLGHINQLLARAQQESSKSEQQAPGRGTASQGHTVPLQLISLFVPSIPPSTPPCSLHASIERTGIQHDTGDRFSIGVKFQHEASGFYKVVEVSQQMTSARGGKVTDFPIPIPGALCV